MDNFIAKIKERAVELIIALLSTPFMNMNKGDGSL